MTIAAQWLQSQWLMIKQLHAAYTVACAPRSLQALLVPFSQNCFDHLVTNFNFGTNLKYEIAVMYFSTGNVIANGKGVDVTLELMYGASYGNLFTNIHLGKGTEPFGWVVRGQDASGFNTFWNIRTTNDTLQLPPATWAPRVTFVHAENAVAVRFL